ncbi:MAG: ABC transporter permease [Micromonosporaceae bacterium]
MKLARDTWLTFLYEVELLVRSPVNVAVTLIQPLTYLLFFTPFLKAVMGVNSYGAAYQIYVPSLFAAMGVFSGMFAGFALLGAMRQGVITRCRVTPLSRVGLLLGRELQYVLLVVFQALVVVVAALTLGLRVRPADLLFALGLLSMMVLLSVSISFILALVMPDERNLATLINAVSQPISLLAGVLIPLSVAPLWVQNVALWNPFAWGTNSMRAVFHGELSSNVVWQASLILTVLAVVSVVASSRLFNRANA